MSKKYKIALDMDEVLADLMGAWVSWYREKACIPDETNIPIDQWDMAKNFVDMDDEEVYSFLDEEGTFLNLEPIRGAINGTKMLMDEFEVYFLTAATAPTAFSEKIKWIESHFGKKYANRVIGVSNGKLKHFLGDLFDFVIDDNPIFLEGILGAKTILFTCEHNMKIDHTEYADLRVTNWEELVSWLTVEKRKMNGVLTEGENDLL